MCELHNDELEADTEFDQVPFQIKELALKHFEDLVSTILENTRYIYLFPFWIVLRNMNSYNLLFFSIGRVFVPIPFTINFKSIRVYLLLWNLILQLCLKLKGKEGSIFISYLK